MFAVGVLLVLNIVQMLPVIGGGAKIGKRGKLIGLAMIVVGGLLAWGDYLGVT